MAAPATDLFFPVVQENAPAGTFVASVGTLSRSDVRYELADDADGRFAVDPLTGVITVSDGSKIDHEASLSHNIQLTVTDNSEAGSSETHTLTIFVRDINEAPTNIGLEPRSLPENAPGVVVGQLLAEDQDIGDSHTYTISDDRFEVVDGTLKLKDGVSLDHESEPEIQLTIAAIDEGGLSSEPIQLTIDVTDVNDAPVLEANTLTISEGGSVLIGPEQLRASDVDNAPDELTFAISDLSGGQFERVTEPGVGIDSFTQADINAALIQFVHDGGEQAPRYTVTLNDGLATAGPQLAAITFENVNDAPVLEANTLTISEGGSVLIGPEQLRASDVDNAPDELTFAISDLSGGQFERVTEPGVGIDSFTQADINAALIQFVHDGGEQAPRYTVTLNDGLATAGPQLAAITFENVNDAPVLEANTLTISEGGSVLIGPEQLRASDVDNAPDELTFAISDLSGGQFERVTEPGVGIDSFTQADINAALIQFVHDGGEQAPRYTVTLNDGLATAGPQLAAITFENVNDAPVLEANTLTISEGGSVLIGPEQLRASDVDNAPDELTFAISDLSGGQFERVTEPGVGIDSFTQADINAALIQFVHDGGEQAPRYTVTLNDGLATAGPQLAAITFENVNDAPTALSLSNSGIAENAANGTIIGTAWAADPDRFDVSTYQLTNDADGRFDIQPTSGRLTVNDSSRLNFEDPDAAGVYQIEIKATDLGGLAISEQFRVNLQDLNETPTDIFLNGGIVTPDVTNDETAGILTTIDPDTTSWNPLPEIFSYALLDDAQGRFALDGDRIVVIDSSRIGDGDQYELLVRSTDKGGLFAEKALDIHVSSFGTQILGFPTPDDDLLIGSVGPDYIDGLGGNDTIDGYIGPDVLLGNDGDDVLNGGTGADPDTLYGGIGSDVFVFAPFHGPDSIEDFEVGDVIDLSDYGLERFDSVRDSFQDVGQGIYIDLRDGASIMVHGVTPADLDNPDHFVI